MEDFQGTNPTKSDPNYDMGMKGLKEFSSATFKKLYRGEPSDVQKDLMQNAFQRCVKTQQYSVINDIINYSRQK